MAEAEKEAVLVERHSTMAATPTAPADAAETAFGIFTPSEPRYYKTTELSERPKVVRDIPKDLTEKLPEGIAGDAILNLKISESGTIEGVSIEASSLDAESLDQLKQAVENMRFTPGKVGKESVKTELRIQVTIEDLRGLRSPR